MRDCPQRRPIVPDSWMRHVRYNVRVLDIESIDVAVSHVNNLVYVRKPPHGHCMVIVSTLCCINMQLNSAIY